MFTIQHSLWNQPPYQTLDYIDEQSPILQEQIPYRYSTRHRNVNGQLSINDITYSSIVKFNKISNDKYNDIEILKISVPLLNQYSSNSIISFDSQVEINEFNQMSSICMDK